jgi:hypothetical protein
MFRGAYTTEALYACCVAFGLLHCAACDDFFLQSAGTELTVWIHTVK